MDSITNALRFEFSFFGSAEELVEVTTDWATRQAGSRSNRGYFNGDLWSVAMAYRDDKYLWLGSAEVRRRSNNLAAGLVGHDTVQIRFPTGVIEELWNPEIWRTLRSDFFVSTAGVGPHLEVIQDGSAVIIDLDQRSARPIRGVVTCNPEFEPETNALLAEIEDWNANAQERGGDTPEQARDTSGLAGSPNETAAPEDSSIPVGKLRWTNSDWLSYFAQKHLSPETKPDYAGMARETGKSQETVEKAYRRLITPIA